MQVWAAMLLAPTLALAQQSVLLALMRAACEHNATGWLHALALVFVLACAGATLPAVFALRDRSASAAAARERADADTHPLPDADPGGRHGFLCAVAVGVGVLSTLASLAMWLPQWWLSPCVH